MTEFDKLYKQIILEYVCGNPTEQREYEKLINNDSGEVLKLEPIIYKRRTILLFVDNAKEKPYIYFITETINSPDDYLTNYGCDFETKQDAIDAAKFIIDKHFYPWWIDKKTPDSQNRYWFTIHITDRHMHKPQYTRRDYVIASNSREAYDLIEKRYKGNYYELYYISE